MLVPVRQATMITLSTTLTFSGHDVPFDEITRLVGVRPTRLRRRAEFPNPALGADQWAFRTQGTYPIPEDGAEAGREWSYPDVMTQLRHIQSLVGDRAEQVGAWCRAHDVRALFQVVIQADTEELPMMTLPSDFVSFACALGASVDFDVYVNVAEPAQE